MRKQSRHNIFRLNCWPTRIREPGWLWSDTLYNNNKKLGLGVHITFVPLEECNYSMTKLMPPLLAALSPLENEAGDEIF